MQKGTIRREARKNGDVYVLRIYAVRALDNKKVERTEVIGPCSRFPDVTAARVEVDRKHLLLKYTEPDKYQGPLTFGELARRWETHELDPELQNAKRAHSTRKSLQMYLNLHIMPRWQNEVAEEMEPLPIECWLKELQAKHSLANGTVTRLKQIMSMAFKFGRKYKLITKDCDPTREVECSSVTDYAPKPILPSQAGAILRELENSPLECTLILLLAATGMRVSEALGLKWEDIDYKEGVIRISRAWTAAHLGRTKTAASRSTVPCIPILTARLQLWHAESKFKGSQDFVFASESRKGKIPRTAGMIVKDYLVPAAVRAGVIKEGESIGVHCLRHSLASFLVSAGFSSTVAQRMLRHSNAHTTQQYYLHTVPSELLQAQDSVMREILQ